MELQLISQIQPLSIPLYYNTMTSISGLGHAEGSIY
jgi:hypothetical protein